MLVLVLPGVEVGVCCRGVMWGVEVEEEEEEEEEEERPTVVVALVVCSIRLGVTLYSTCVSCSCRSSLICWSLASSSLSVVAKSCSSIVKQIA